MAEPTGGNDFEEISPDEAFSLLGNETRIGIVRALWELLEDPREKTSFSALREHADVADSGQFNYHLGKLVGTFVQHDEDGYDLTYAGRRVIGAILDGAYTKRTSIASFDIGVSCAICGSVLEASYEDETFVIQCPNCEMKVQYEFPPGALDGRTREELIETFTHWIRAQFSLVVNGICPDCAGVVTHSIAVDFELRNHEVGVEFGCERCLHSGQSTIGWYLAYHPTVISFYDDHGLDLAEELLGHVSDQTTTVLTEDPWRIGVTVSLSGDELELVVDEELNVVERRHT